MSSLVQIMACRLFGDNPLSKPMIVYCQLDSKEHFSVKSYLKLKSFHSRKCIWKCCLENGNHFDSCSLNASNDVIYFFCSCCLRTRCCCWDVISLWCWRSNQRHWRTNTLWSCWLYGNGEVITGNMRVFCYNRCNLNGVIYQWVSGKCISCEIQGLI